MTIYVDQPTVYPNAPTFYGRTTQWCHLWSDSNDAEEVKVFGALIGLQPGWFQDREGFPHFDLTPSNRKVALMHGAQEHSLKAWIKERMYPV